ncbi:MAG: hypothetical protein AAFS04_10455 [Cyanobacteria bacterium J06631_9]
MADFFTMLHSEPVALSIFFFLVATCLIQFPLRTFLYFNVFSLAIVAVASASPGAGEAINWVLQYPGVYVYLHFIRKIWREHINKNFTDLATIALIAGAVALILGDGSMAAVAQFFDAHWNLMLPLAIAAIAGYFWIRGAVKLGSKPYSKLSPQERRELHEADRDYVESVQRDVQREQEQAQRQKDAFKDYWRK